MIKTLFVLVAILLIIFAWAPWLNQTNVENSITQKFNEKWYAVQDGCGPIKEMKDTSRFIFGFTSSIRYACGMGTAEDSGTWHHVFVDPFLGVFVESNHAL